MPKTNAVSIDSGKSDEIKTIIGFNRPGKISIETVKSYHDTNT